MLIVVALVVVVAGALGAGYVALLDRHYGPGVVPRREALALGAIMAAAAMATAVRFLVALDVI